MANEKTLPEYSIGVGDRFAHQAKAQLRACIMARESGVEVIPVWNKSNREHTIIGSDPRTTRAAADAAVKALAWTKPYFVDADHITLKTVDRFAVPCDFFTIDVADLIAQLPDPAAVEMFVNRHPELIGDVRIPGVNDLFRTGRDLVSHIVGKYLAAIQEAGRIYRYIAASKGAGNFVPEISMDETDAPQTPIELLVILAAIADEQIPIRTIAPKFTGRFNKGVDYSANLEQFSQEVADDLAVIASAVQQYGLPQKLPSSGEVNGWSSDQFVSALRPIRNRALTTAASVSYCTLGSKSQRKSVTAI